MGGMCRPSSESRRIHRAREVDKRGLAALVEAIGDARVGVEGVGADGEPGGLRDREDVLEGLFSRCEAIVKGETHQR